MVVGILVRGARLRIATAFAVLGLGATGCGTDATTTPTEIPPSAETATPTVAVAATATPLSIETTPVLPGGSPANPLDAGGAYSGNDIVVSGGAVDLFAYQAVAEGGGSRPAVIVIHENQGLTPFARDVVDGLASSGYLAIAPDLLSHEGGTAQAGDIPTALRGISMDRHVSDVEAVVAYLKSQPDVGQIGIIGFCFGGGVVWNVATTNSDIAAAVPFYGSNPTLEGVPNITARRSAASTALSTTGSTQASPRSRRRLRAQASSTSLRCTPTLPTHSSTTPTLAGTSSQPPWTLGPTLWTGSRRT